MNNYHIDDATVHDISAFLFWTLSEKVGYDSARNMVMQSSGNCLLSQSFTNEILARYKLSNLSSDIQKALRESVAKEAMAYAIKKENMLGIVYAEDTHDGRSPTAKQLDTSHLNIAPKRIIVKSENIRKIGKLCLRHPLPAVVFSATMPKKRIIEVDDTATALGFPLRIFLWINSQQQVEGNAFAISGVFYIPVRDTRQGDQWNYCIQNSIRFAKSATFVNDSSVITTDITIDWDQ